MCRREWEKNGWPAVDPTLPVLFPVREEVLDGHGPCVYHERNWKGQVIQKGNDGEWMV